MSGHLLWAAFVDPRDEKLWRETLGQPSINDWCAAHGWKADDILSGTVNVYAYRDGHAEVTAEVLALDADGKPFWNPETSDAERRMVAARLAQSLPEGIGTVVRP